MLVLNWNGARLLPRCLEALSRTDYSSGRWEVVVVDNNSSDDSVEAAQRDFPWIKVSRHPANLGFGKGYNPAIRRAQGEYVALLNLDTRVRPAWLKELVRAAEMDPRVGATTAKLLFPTDGPLAGRIERAGGQLLADGSGRDRGQLEVDRGQYDTQEEVFYFAGSASLLRKAALQDSGLFDERYFMYYEDVDLSWRLRLRGWKIVYVPTAVVEHEHAASSGEWSPLFIFNVDRNRQLMLFKLAPWPLALREAARYVAEWALNCARVAFWAATRRQRGPHAARARLQARVIASWLWDLPGVLGDRAAIRSERRAARGVVERWLERSVVERT